MIRLGHSDYKVARKEGDKKGDFCLILREEWARDMAFGWQRRVWRMSHLRHLLARYGMLEWGSEGKEHL